MEKQTFINWGSEQKNQNGKQIVKMKSNREQYVSTNSPLVTWF